MDDTTSTRFATGTALLTAILGVVAFGLAIIAVPIAGANCPSGCIPYPYTSTAARWPQDFLWQIPAIAFVLSWLVLMVCVHYFAPQQRRMITLAGLCLAVIAAAALSIDYYLQLSVVPVSLADGETNGLPLLIQYNAHGVFIALEEIGYITMALSLALFSVAFTGRDRLATAGRWLFRVPIVVAVGGLLEVSVFYGLERQDRFEIFILSACWLTLIAGGLILAAIFWTMTPEVEATAARRVER